MANSEQLSDDTHVPQHVSIIMDGNGRWAQGRAMQRSDGHLAGVQTVLDIISAADQRGVKYLSLFAFGQDNYLRPQNEVDGLMALGSKSLAKYFKQLHKNGVRLCFIGDLSKLPGGLRMKMSSAEQTMQNNTGIRVIIAFNYSGRWDITQAVARLMQQGTTSTDADYAALIEANLQTTGIPDPDLFIRTSGEQRISNYYLWQLSYTELYFTDVCWPEFTAEEFDCALSSYAKRQRRYGMTMEQI